MPRIPKFLLITLSVIALATLVAYFLQSIRFLSLVGLVVVSISFALFSLTQFFIDTANKLNLVSGNKLLEFLKRTGIDIALFVRGVFLSVGTWAAGFYFSLLEFNPAKLLGDFQTDILLSLFGTCITLADSIRGGSINKQSFLTKLSSIMGYFCFLRNMTILVFGLGGYDLYRALMKIFDSPLWFLERTGWRVVSRLYFSGDFLLPVCVSIAFPSIGIYTLLKEKPRKEFMNDWICIQIGGLAYFIWVLSIPGYLIYSFLASLLEG